MPTPVRAVEMPVAAPLRDFVPTRAPVSADAAADAIEAAADDRIKRYEQALTDPTVREWIKRFEADILAREPGDRTAWLERLKRS